MLKNLQGLLVPAVIERLVLVINHVLAAEPAATFRLLPHRGRTLELELQNWPSLLPTLPRLQLRITPAGLMEWSGIDPPGSPDLSVRVEAGNPALLFARALAGEPPRLAIAGDAQLATDIQWLMDNVRWDVEADLDRLFGPVVAAQLGRMGSALARGLRGMARGVVERTARAP